MEIQQKQQSKSGSEGSDIPNEIMKDIFWKLPLTAICRLKTVCKGWNALLSSTDFWTRHPSINPNHSWLLFGIDHRALPNILYSLSTNTWKTIPITFMPRYKTGVKYYGSSRGILLVGVGAHPQNLFICNPFLRQFRQLPPTLSVELNSFTPKGIVICEDQVNYKVVVICPDHTKSWKVIEIYNSSSSSWKIVGKIRRDLTLRKEIVFCNSFFFCLVSHPQNLMGYCSIEEDVCKKMKYVKLPVPDPHGGFRRYSAIHYNLVALGASILLTAMLSDMTIWEFQMINGNAEGRSAHSNSLWKKIARMPDNMCAKFGANGCWYECVGEGDYVCFRKGRSEEVVTYNVREESWKWVPPSPCKWVTKVQAITGFALRPDFKL